MSRVTIAGVPLEVVSTKPTHIKAVDSDGREYSLRKRSITVTTYAALCDDRPYTARRTSSSPFTKRREITDASGRLVGVTEANMAGEIELTTDTDLDLDLGFIAWALIHVDSPRNNLRLA